MELNKKQKLAISKMNKALKLLQEADIRICGMDCNLHYATLNAISERPGTHSFLGDYCGVARACQHSDEGTGTFNAECYQDSGGW